MALRTGPGSPGPGAAARLVVVGTACVLLAACSPPAPPQVPAPAPSTESAGPTTVEPTADPWADVSDFVPGLVTWDSALPEQSVEGDPVEISLGEGEDPVGSFRRTNVGLSFEASDLADERWEPGTSSLTPLIAALNQPSLRFGGNAVDRRVWWTSSDESAPDWAEFTIGPDDLERIARFAEATDASVTLVLPLGHFDPERAADMAAHAERALGDRLVAVAFGNEPNGFHHESQLDLALRDEDWDADAWVEEAEDYVDAVHDRVPGLPVDGPGAYDAPWWRAFGGADIADKAALSQHWYPLWSCPDRSGETEERAEPEVENLTSQWLHERAETVFGQGKDTADNYDLPLWIEETGPTSCPGTNDSSRTHAQTLWTADFVMIGAGVGAQRMNHHSSLAACRGGAPMSMVCGMGAVPNESPRVIAQSNYLALLMLSQVGTGELVEISSSDPEVRAYAVDAEDFTDIVLVDTGEPGTDRAVDLSVDADRLDGISTLTAESMEATNEGRLRLLSETDAVPDSLPRGSVTLLRFGR
ncbi:hypothetical protein ACF3NT_14925 [Naumannella halotolerans]|uniref:hypothetical protein n=1 Tax=Naumannella halotolerans TaxID=993414 RepID=UPI00370D5C69